MGEASSFETELKFQVPPGRRSALRRALGQRVERLRMSARYFDTADGRLAAAGLALRLRREGRARWVQTLKGRGEGLMQRLEHEVVLGAREAAQLDLSRHDGTPAGARLSDALAGATPQERFAVEVVRTRRVLHTRGAAGSARVELAFDEGAVRAGDAEHPVCEIEFELQDGSLRALLALAARWVRAHGLWLDVRSKAEVGHRLASGAGASATGAQAAIVSARMGPRRALAALLQSCLAQVLPNLAELAGPIGAPAPEEVLHQLRVGLRRARTALREFGGDATGADAGWGEALAGVFRTLGVQRDRDVIAATLAPARELARAAGLGSGPEPAAAAAGQDDPAAGLRDPAFQALLLALIDFVGAAAEAPDAADGAPLLARARARLKRLHRRIASQAEAFTTLPDDARHRLRKQAKRLRYALECCAPLFGRKACKRYLGALRDLQQALGDLNDLAVAETWLGAQAAAADAAFLRGWVAARQQVLLAQGAAALRALARAARPWA